MLDTVPWGRDKEGRNFKFDNGYCVNCFCNRIYEHMADKTTINDLSAEQAYATGSAVGALLQQGMPTENTVTATHAIAEFIRKGMAAQQAVDEILERL